MEKNLILNPGSSTILHVTTSTHSSRLDAALVSMVPSYSRNFFQHLIKDGLVQVNDKQITKASFIVQANDAISVSIPPKRCLAPENVIETVKTKNLAIDIVCEHEHFLIVYKPAGIMVHAPSERSDTVTLVDWLIVNYPDLLSVGHSDRPGIVHRIDMDTSGLLVVPRTPFAHAIFSQLFKNRTIHKTYLAVVEGNSPQCGTIDFAIGRSPQGNKMAVYQNYNLNGFSSHRPKARHAITHYTTKQYYENASLIEANIITGRTHQIRVHFSSIGHPIVGDTLYGHPSKLIQRQALHAYSVEFVFDGNKYSFCKEVPGDFQKLLNKLSV